MPIFKSRRSGVDLRKQFAESAPLDEVAADLASQLLPNRKGLIAWSSGRDEEFGGRFFCFHGLNEEEHDALKALAQSFKFRTGATRGPQDTRP